MNGLNDLASQTTNKKQSRTASMLYMKLESGKSISESMSDYPDLFPSYYTSMVKAGEAAGSLEQILIDLMHYLEWQIKLKKDVKAALAYPAMVFSAVVGLVLILFSFVMPKFIKILTDLRAELPMPTRILIWTVDFVKGYLPFIIIFLVALPLLYRLVRRNAAAARLIDRFMIGLPLIGSLITKLNHSRYFRTFAILYSSGLSMNETLRVSASVVSNRIVAESFEKVANSVLGGEQINRALRMSGGFGPLLLNMVEIGEKTGTLDETVTKISSMYDKEIPETIKKVFTVVEPLIIVMLGAIVLLTLASFFLPLYKIVGNIRMR
jgi:type II secretory pathway component PulF